MPALSDYFFCRILKPERLIYTKFLRPTDHDEYKTAMLFVLGKIEELELVMWVMDSTLSYFTVQDQKWSVEYLGLLLKATTLKNFGMIRGKDAMLHMVAESMRSKIYRIFGDQIQLEQFEDLSEAMKFLLPDTNTDKLLLELAEGDKNGKLEK